MALAGDLSEFPLTDIIQLVDLSKKTGSAFLQGQRGNEQLEGRLYFRDGKIVGAVLGTMPPLEAAYTFFTFTSGPFRFDDEAALEVPTITQSNEMIIMEGIMRQDAWEKMQSQMPPLTMIPRLVPNPAATGAEINLEAEEWRVLTMVNGKNTIGQIAQRSGLGELRTCEIIARLLGSGLIEKREINLADTLFPDLERIAINAFGNKGRSLLEEAYTRSGIKERTKATLQQMNAALDLFEASSLNIFGLQIARQPLADMRGQVQQVFNSL